jgi:hypothetical protein
MLGDRFQLLLQVNLSVSNCEISGRPIAPVAPATKIFICEPPVEVCGRVTDKTKQHPCL